MLYDKDIREPLFDFLDETYGKIRMDARIQGEQQAVCGGQDTETGAKGAASKAGKRGAVSVRLYTDRRDNQKIQKKHN